MQTLELRRLNAWASLLGGDRKLARAVADVAAVPYPWNWVEEFTEAGDENWGGCSAPYEKLPFAALARLSITGGLTLFSNWPHANDAPKQLADACRIVLWFEQGNGCVLPKPREKLQLPRYGWGLDGEGAAPIAPIQRTYVDATRRLVAVLRSIPDDGWSAVALDPFTKKRFHIALGLGRRTPDRPPRDWRGPRAIFLEFSRPAYERRHS